MPPSKILILKPSSLGDIVQAMPVLRMLKRQYPASRIYWWIAAEFAPLLEDDPDLAGLFVFPRKQWIHPRFWRDMGRSILQMRQQNFDWVIDLQSLARSALVAWLARGKLTVGLADPREGAEAFYDLAVPRPRTQHHAVDWYLHVLTALQVPCRWDFEWLPENPQAARTVAAKCPAREIPWIAIHSGARWPTKRWPMENYAQLMTQLAASNSHLRFLILGSSNGDSTGSRLIQAAPERCLDLTGKTSLLELIEWLRLSRLLITNDTGPMHIAAALNKPVVALFGPTDPQRTGPYGQLDRTLQLSLPCQPCLRSVCHYARKFACLRELKPDQVLVETQRRLQAA
jgi:heptosyltransferase I